MSDAVHVHPLQWESLLVALGADSHPPASSAPDVVMRWALWRVEEMHRRVASLGQALHDVVTADALSPRTWRDEAAAEFAGRACELIDDGRCAELQDLADRYQAALREMAGK